MYKQRIFDFYPKNICWEVTPEKYISSQEYINLSKVLNFSPKEKSRVDHLAAKLELQFNPIMYHHLERCLTYQYVSSDATRICIDFSLLFPVSTIYTVERTFDENMYDKLVKANPIDKLIAAKKASTISYLKNPPNETKKALLQTQAELKRQSGLELLDYESCTNTAIPGINRLNDCGEMNLFNALFKEELSFI